MGSSGAGSVIHRKAQVARDGFDAREMSAPKALRLALSRAGDALHGLALRVQTLEQQELQLPGIEEAVGEDGLLILLDGAEGERGAIKLDLQFVAGLIEMQLTGRIKRAEAAPRAFTPTDAAIAEPLLNALLDGAEEELAEAGLPPIAPGLRFGDRIEDGRALALALAAPDYDLYRLTVDMDRGAKTGVLTLILPQRPAPSLTSDGPEERSLQARLEQNALNAPVMLDAVLGRVRLPLREICDWAPGMVVALPPDVLDGARLLGAKGHRVARVKLGQLNGFRAVRLLTDEHEAADRPNDEIPAAAQPDGQVGEALSLDTPPSGTGQFSPPDRQDGPAAQTDWPEPPGGSGDLPDLGTLSAWDEDAQTDDGLPMPADFPDLPDLPGLDAVNEG